MTYAEQLKEAHKARRARIAAKAVADTPLRIASASDRCGGLREMPASESGEEAPCQVVDAAWVERQIKKHQQPYKPWFSIADSAEDPFVHEIMVVCAKHFRTSVRDLTSARRDQPTAWVRHIAMFLAKEQTGRSLPAIGRVFGGRDHTTVLHGIRHVQRRLLSEPELAQEIADLKLQIQIMKDRGIA